MAWLVTLSFPVAPATGVDLDAVTARFWDLGTTGVAELVRPDGGTDLVAGFDRRREAETAAARLGPAGRAGGGTVSVAPVDPSAWTGAVPGATVTLAGRTVELDVGPAFGHGGHPTTVLALELVSSLVQPGDTVVDLGTGTGILALAALAAGAGRVLAVDDDPAALGVAAGNVASHTGLGPGRVELASSLPRPDGEPANLVVANVLLPVHRALAADLDRWVGPGGLLVLSGFLTDQADEVAGLHPTLVSRERRRHDDWAALLLGRP